MTYKVLPTKEFSKQFKTIGAPLQLRIKKKLEMVAKNPTRFKQLQYDLVGSSRIRIGTLRVIFSYNTDKKELYLETIIHDHNYKA